MIGFHEIWFHENQYAYGIYTYIIVLGHYNGFLFTPQQLLECILSVNVGVLQQSANSRGGRLRGVQCHLLQDAPTSFCEAVVGLAVELICVTQLQADFNPRFRYMEILNFHYTL